MILSHLPHSKTDGCLCSQSSNLRIRFEVDVRNTYIARYLCLEAWDFLIGKRTEMKSLFDSPQRPITLELIDS